MSYLWNMLLCICFVLPIAEAIVRRSPDVPLLRGVAAIVMGATLGAIGSFALYKISTRLRRSDATIKNKEPSRTRPAEFYLLVGAAAWTIAVGITSSYAADYIYRLSVR